MPQKLPIYTDVPSHRYRIALDGVQYELRLTYRDRTASWYLDLWDEDGGALLLGRRLSPGWSPNFGVLTGGPPGLLLVLGADPYPRGEIELWYYTAEEVEAARPADGELLPVELSS